MIKKFLPRSDLFKNISTLVVGTFFAQMVAVLLQIVLRRMYPAEDFGAFAVYISITGVLLILATFRYEMAVVLPEKKSDASNLVFLGIFLCLFFSLGLFLVILLLKSEITALLNLDPRYGFILYFSPLSIFLFGSYQVINYYLVREKSYRAVAINKISRRIAEGGTQTAMGWIGQYTTGLIAGDITGHLINNVSGWYQMIRHGFTFRYFSIKRQWHLLKEYRELPLYNLIPAFLNAASMHLPLILVNKFYAQQTAAYFDLTRWVLAFPASLLALSISQVMLQNISDKNRNRQSIRGDIINLSLGLTVLSLGMILVIGLWGPWLFSLYAGAEYHASGVYARILVVGAALKLIVSPLSSIFIALNRIKLVSLWQALYFLSICGLYFFQGLDIISFLKVYLIIDIFFYGIYFAMILRLTNKYERTII